MEALGFSNEDVIDIFRIIAAILKLGNLTFSPINNMDGTEGCSITNEYGKWDYVMEKDPSAEIGFGLISAYVVPFYYYYYFFNISRWLLFFYNYNFFFLNVAYYVRDNVDSYYNIVWAYTKKKQNQI